MGIPQASLTYATKTFSSCCKFFFRVHIGILLFIFFNPHLQPLYDGTETGRNRPISQDLFESDIVLTVDQLKGIVLAEKERRTGRREQRRYKRKVITGSIYRWNVKQPIPYEFKSDDGNLINDFVLLFERYIDGWRNIIRSALNFWQSETCVRWAENGPGIDRVIFFKGSGCYSSVGRTGGRQQISIGYGCEDKGIVTHEVGHSLGFWHEQSRPDRDRYIQLKQEYIARGTEGNFVKRSIDESDDVGLPYDLGSVMHYGPNAFTIDWDHTTIETVDKNYKHTIGQRAGPSFVDVKQVNRLYCNDRCVGSTLSCQNGGYPDPNNCFVCKCPTGLGGSTCESVQPSDCGSELIASTLWQHLIYKGSQRCYWRIKTNEARIRILLDSVSFKCDATCRSYVELKHNSDFQQTGFRSCCSEKELEIVSEQNEVLVIVDATELNGEGSFNSGKPLRKPPPPIWVPGSENRLFRGTGSAGGKGGPIERFILNSIPQIRDPNHPVESIASIVTEFTLSQLLGASRDR
ncbi:unnamed protein product [Toxocara canis]|uniref:Metalloendopeptidase n=1 Tax=Toxocara canis TaxID=6265 RepID=A0A3P7IBV4_TOXCA|nr:unnamed protein product [Toxocara canis]